jgi:aspartate racemase
LIFDDLCHGRFDSRGAAPFLGAIDGLAERGAEAVILGCTEIPIVVNDGNSSLPTLDTTRLLAGAAVRLATSSERLPGAGEWIHCSPSWLG